MLSPRFAAATAPPTSGLVPPELVRAFQDGLFSVPARSTGLGASTVSGTWKLPVVIVSFSDDTIQVPARDFETELFDTTGAVPTGSFYDYYRWVSKGRVRVLGRVVASVRLPEDRAFYAGNNWGMSALGTPNNSLGYARDALQRCQSSVNWPEFDLDHDGYVDMLWLVHAGVGGESSDRTHLWSMTSRMSGSWSQAGPFVTTIPLPGGSPGQMMRLDRFTVLPEKSSFHPEKMCEIGVFCHEFGHTLGLPDLYDIAHPTNSGPGNWSLMSSGAYGSDGMSPQYPAHMGAWPMQYMGWDRTRRPNRDTTITIDAIEDSSEVVDFWFQGEDYPEHFLIETRRRFGFDHNLPEEGLLVYHVDETIIGQRLLQNLINAGPTPGLKLVEADGHDDLGTGQNRGDVNDPFPGQLDRRRFDDTTIPSTRTFNLARTDLAMDVLGSDGDGMRVHLRVRPPGWLAIEDKTPAAGFQPFGAPGAAQVSGIDAQNVSYIARSVYVGGRPQVLLFSSVSWSEPLQLSHSTGAAIDPALAILPGGDLAAVWSDTRQGRAQLYYRARIRGIWTEERQLLTMPGNCRSPALAADHRGGLSLAFQYADGDSVQIQFMRFTYFSPFGQSKRVVGFPQRPENASVLTDPGGNSWVLWQDRSPPSSLWFARFRTDSGLTAPQALTSFTIQSQTAYSAALDSVGGLHLVWQVSGPGVNELRYQHRYGSAAPDPVDLPLEQGGDPVQAPRIAIDRDQSLHLVYESSRSVGTEVRYRRMRPNGEWDARPTNVSYGGTGSAVSPIALPTHDGNVTVASVGAGSPLRFLVRRRELVPDGRLSAPPPAAAVLPGLVLGPNPLRAGRSIELWLSAHDTGSVPEVEFLDLAGRRVARTRLTADGRGWHGRVEGAATRDWPSGLYFVRAAGTNHAARLVVVH